LFSGILHFFHVKSYLTFNNFSVFNFLKIQADAEAKDAADRAAHLKKIEDAEVVESKVGLDMKEM
jgi:hypothetical protein